MFDDRGHRIATGVANAHRATGAVPDDMGHALLVILAVVLGLIALLIVLARLEPPKGAQHITSRPRVSTAREHDRLEPHTPRV